MVLLVLKFTNSPGDLGILKEIDKCAWGHEKTAGQSKHCVIESLASNLACDVIWCYCGNVSK